ncbi:MAG: hypothetical protein ACI89D_000659 [Bermanella sp.]|jgi:hypothetical protein
MRNQILRLATICIFLASGQSFAQISTRIQASDVGLGAELGYRWDSQWGLRVGYLRGNLDFTFDADDTNDVEGDELEYDSEVNLENFYLLADWHPWNRYFRLTGGVFFNHSNGRIVTRCNAPSLSPTITQPLIPTTSNCEFGNSRFPVAILGEVTTKIDFETIAPYLGMGWGHRPVSGFAFNADVGVIYVGSASIDISSSGSCNSNEQCRNELENEEREIEDELEDYTFVPFVSLGLSYLF